jgi:hypothetical protein
VVSVVPDICPASPKVRWSLPRAATVFVVIATALALAGEPEPPVAREPIAAILAAFSTHDIVALGEGPHGNLEGHEFRVRLVRDPRFVDIVNDIVVEFGSSRYQGVMDRFVAGEDVERAVLRHVWQDTTTVTPAWDRPIYEEFFRVIREVNSTRAQGQQLRVLLGDAPIDWSTTKTREDVHRWGLQKGRHTADVIQREVLAKHRKALVIYGDSHLQGRRVPDRRLPINILESPPIEARILTIAPIFRAFVGVYDDARQWPAPSLIMIRGTVIGARPLASFYPLPPAPGWSSLKMEDAYDAVLFMGDKSPTMSRLTREQCADAGYMKMRLDRMALDVPQARQARIDSLKQLCAALMSK